jgi:ABC-type sulfate/molybdate transport systems ATPase subunit
MGRAIVRQPQAFLMDEPLSNLDAKLRVEMRAEIARPQRELAVTTVYVTHDQTEAMTMGTRVAVLRGRMQQVDTRARRSPVLAALHQTDRVALVPDGLPAGALGAAVVARHSLGVADPTLADAAPNRR